MMSTTEMTETKENEMKAKFTTEVVGAENRFSVVVRRDGEHTATLGTFPSREWADQVEARLYAKEALGA